MIQTKITTGDILAALKQTAISIDQTLNTLTWIKGDGFGYADETLSARAWRLRGQSNAYKRIDKIFFFDPDHCKTSYESEVERKHLPPEYRNTHPQVAVHHNAQQKQSKELRVLYKVFYTDRFIPSKFSGLAIGPFILIRPSHKDNKGLLEHEKVHVRQFWRTAGMHGIIYKLSKQYRLKCEVEAYKEQMKYQTTDKRAVFAGFISTKYGLDITQEQAIELLTE